MGVRKFLLLLTVATIVVLAVVVWFYPSGEDFRTDNPFWNGLRRLSGELRATRLDSFHDLPSSPVGAALVVIPCFEFDESEVDALEDFVTRGGTLIILDDYGHGNDILNHLGLEAAFTQGALLDPVFNYKNSRFPRITHFEQPAVGADVESIVLNHATTLEGVLDSEVLAWSSRFSYLDLDHNSSWDDGEQKGPLPVAAALRVNKGCVVLVSDPSILINSMEGMDSNQAFVESIARIQYAEPEKIIDQTHMFGTALDQAKGTLATIREGLASSTGTLLLVVAMLVTILSPLWRGKGKIDL